MMIEKPRIKKSDLVQVIAGREKGKTGKVLRVYGKTSRVLVEKVNVVKRHVRPSQQNPQGGIQEKELPLAYSNVLLMCPKCNRGVRVGVKMAESTSKRKATNAGKIRFCKKCKGNLD